MCWYELTVKFHGATTDIVGRPSIQGCAFTASLRAPHGQKQGSIYFGAGEAPPNDPNPIPKHFEKIIVFGVLKTVSLSLKSIFLYEGTFLWKRDVSLQTGDFSPKKGVLSVHRFFLIRIYNSLPPSPPLTKNPR